MATALLHHGTVVELDVEGLEALYQTPKQLVEPIDWEQEPGSGRYYMQALVQVIDGNELLTVGGSYWEVKYSFFLRYQNHAIRVWDFNGHHDGIDGGHKHRYREWDIVDDDPYPVDDVTTSDVNQALMQFLEECSIRPRDQLINDIPDMESHG